jgi:hypothetical protein
MANKTDEKAAAPECPPPPRPSLENARSASMRLSHRAKCKRAKRDRRGSDEAPVGNRAARTGSMFRGDFREAAPAANPPEPPADIGPPLERPVEAMDFAVHAGFL